ncbi:hypothetical protein C8T65DRAFT_738384 [Cerioporus squamosus]|nr:hypothetical protein C8T65DRAFT_738384 [Cerioporus squamosus]
MVVHAPNGPSYENVQTSPPDSRHTPLPASSSLLQRSPISRHYARYVYVTSVRGLLWRKPDTVSILVLIQMLCPPVSITSTSSYTREDIYHSDQSLSVQIEEAELKIVEFGTIRRVRLGAVGFTFARLMTYPPVADRRATRSATASNNPRNHLPPTTDVPLNQRMSAMLRGFSPQRHQATSGLALPHAYKADPEGGTEHLAPRNFLLSLLSGEQVKRKVTASLYKLNDSGESLALVLNITDTDYTRIHPRFQGEGAFFKAHKTTPLNSKMFGSLVVVFLTPHSGGPPTSSVHEVLPVDSGHRVTVTYNLHWDNSNPRETVHPDGVNIFEPTNANANNVGRELSALLDNPASMSEGDMLGFRLRHSYLFPRVWNTSDPDPLSELPMWLKGSDAALIRGVRGRRTAAQAAFLHRGGPGRFDFWQVEEPERELPSDHGGVIVHTTQKPGVSPFDDEHIAPASWWTRET